MTRYDDGRARHRFVVGLWVAAGAGFASLAVVRTLAGYGLALPYPMVLLVLAVLIVPLLIARLIEERPVPETMLSDPAVERTYPDPDDSVRQAVARWERRLDIRDDDPARGGGIRAVLVELVTDRLRVVHGVDLATEPERAYALVGPRLRGMLTGPPTPLRADDLRPLLAEMEAL
jgi:hypothetical protein